MWECDVGEIQCRLPYKVYCKVKLLSGISVYLTSLLSMPGVEPVLALFVGGVLQCAVRSVGPAMWDCMSE